LLPLIDASAAGALLSSPNVPYAEHRSSKPSRSPIIPAMPSMPSLYWLTFFAWSSWLFDCGSPWTPAGGTAVWVSP